LLLGKNKSFKEKELEISYMGRTLSSFHHLAPERNPLLLDCTCPYVNVEEKNVFTKAERVQQCFRRERNKDIIAITFTDLEYYSIIETQTHEPNETFGDVASPGSNEAVGASSVTIGEVCKLLHQLNKNRKKWSSEETKSVTQGLSIWPSL
jgi:hypothetical protein